MQRDFFDDEKRDTLNPDDDTRREERRAPPPNVSSGAANPHVIDAEVVDEVIAARAHDGGGLPPSKHEKLALFAFVVVLVGSIVLLQGQTKALQSTNFAETPSMQVPVIVRYAPMQKQVLTKDQEIQVSFAEIKDNAAKLRKSMQALSRPSVPQNKVLNAEDYQALKVYLAQKEGITHEEEAREILLQAGYKLPARLPDENGKKSKSKDHVAFARDVINRLLKDEVEDFLEKVQIASEVGVYVAENAEE
jgi:predicted RND superfamily exporter protein